MSAAVVAGGTAAIFQCRHDGADAPTHRFWAISMARLQLRQQPH